MTSIMTVTTISRIVTPPKEAHKRKITGARANTDP